MKRQSTQILIALAAIAVAIFLVASYVGDIVSQKTYKTEPVPLPQKPAAPTTELPQLKLRKDAIKAPGSVEPTEAPLPPPRASGRTGTLGNDEIEQALSQRSSLFQRCWTQRLRENPTLKGTALLQFEITARGKVQNAQIAQSTITDETMLRCLTSVVERVPFRDFDGAPVSLTFPLSFE